MESKRRFDYLSDVDNIIATASERFERIDIICLSLCIVGGVHKPAEAIVKSTLAFIIRLLSVARIPRSQ